MEQRTKLNQDKTVEETGIQSSLTDDYVKESLGQFIEEVKNEGA